MTTFYIIRHGRTQFNEKERVQGWCDSPLTANGQEQMEQLSVGLQDIPFAAIYSSTAPRAKTCAEMLAKGRDLTVQASDSLREISYGSLEGEYLEDAFPQGKLDPSGYGLYDGEDLYTALARFTAEMQKIALEYPDDKVAIVTHGHLIKLLLGNFDPRYSAETIKSADLIPPCSVTILKYDNNHFSLETQPDISWRVDVSCA